MKRNHDEFTYVPIDFSHKEIHDRLDKVEQEIENGCPGNGSPGGGVGASNIISFYYDEKLAGRVDNQTDFPLPKYDSSNVFLELSRNGVELIQGIDYTIKQYPNKSYYIRLAEPAEKTEVIHGEVYFLDPNASSGSGSNGNVSGGGNNSGVTGGTGTANFLGEFNTFVDLAGLGSPEEGSMVTVLRDETCEGIQSLYTYHNGKWVRLSAKVWTVSGSEPSNTSLLWIDISGADPVLKFYNGIKWTALGSAAGGSFKKFPSFEPDTYYSFGDVIMQNQITYSAKASFTSGAAFDVNDWNVVSGDMTKAIYDKNGDGIVDHAEFANVAEIALETSLLQSWKPLTEYIVGQQLVHLNKIYTVTANHTSEAIFETSKLELTATGTHNDLSHLDGGAPNEYYHLAKEQYDIVLTLNNKGGVLQFGTESIGNMTTAVYDKNRDGIVDFAEKLVGVTVSVDNINMLAGVSSNIQQQLDGITKGMVFEGVVATKAELLANYPTPTQGTTVVVSADETQGGVRTFYVYGTNDWVFLGVFEFQVRDFSINPIDLATEVTGLLGDANIDASIARKTDVHTHANEAILETYTNTNADLSDAVVKKHIHNNKAILDGYTNTNTDLTDAVAKKHTHANKGIIDFFSEDAHGNLIYKGAPIQGVGGSGSVDISAFTTNDLRDSFNKRYVTDAEKGNLALLPGIVSDQSNINTVLNSINQKIPSSASATNLLATVKDVEDKTKGFEFKTLSDVDSNTVAPNSVVMMNNTGDKVVFEKDITSFFKIKSLIDKNGTLASDIHSIKFKNLVGKVTSAGEIELESEAMFSTDLLDMPKTFAANHVLVANPDTMSYEAKDIGDLTNSKENFSTKVDIADWSQNVNTGKYEKVIAHNLGSKHVIVAFYDASEKIISKSYRITSVNEITVYSDAPEAIIAVINCSQGMVTTTYSAGGAVTASDFIDDTRVRIDKTYSSSKIMSIFSDYAKASNVYSKVESDAKYALKGNDHTHLNIAVLNGFTTNITGGLFFNGKEVMTNFNPFCITKKWTNEKFDTMDTLVDTPKIIREENIKVILNSELVVQNVMDPADDKDIDEQNTIRLVVADNNIIVLDVLIAPGTTQKYLLGISPNAKVMIKGTFTASLNINAY